MKSVDPNKPNTPTTISQNFDGRILLNDYGFPVNRKNPNPNLFKFCSELRNRKSDPVINIFHGGGQNREFCKTVSRKQNGGVFKCPFLDRGITFIVKEVDTQVGRHSDNTNFVRSPFSSARLKVLLGWPASRAVATLSSMPLGPCCQQVFLTDLQHGGVQPFPLHDSIVRQHYSI